MKFQLLSITMAAFLTATALALGSTRDQPESAPPAKQQPGFTGCSPDRLAAAALISELDVPPIPGAGTYSWKAISSIDSAQFYFDQGINTYYSFHIIESLASFNKAIRFDTSNAMLYWAKALAFGPNINDVTYATAPDAIEAIAKAVTLSASLPATKKGLISALSARYSSDTTISQSVLNRRYMEQMKLLYLRFPDDADIATLYADALMLLHPWDLWFNTGKPKPWTPGIREVLEKVLAHTPAHPGANHYYIHVMEASPFAGNATASADRLGKLTPGLAHTVHMPSHIYLRTGRYEDGIAANESSLKSYQTLASLFPAVIANDFLYSIHNRHMLVNNAMLAGQSRVSLAAATELAGSIPTDYLSLPGAIGNVMQYIYMTPVLVRVRFGLWDQLLQTDKPDGNMLYAGVLYHWGRGMAFAKTAHLREATIELDMIDSLMKDSSLLEPFTPFSPAIDGAVVARSLLAGTILEKEGRLKEAITHFEIAVTTEKEMVYNEPRDWMLNPAHYLGSAYIADKQFGLATKIFKDDLLNNRDNPWALAGLMQASKGDASKEFAKKLKVAGRSADVVINRSVL
ncbi:MAG: hypothetical protein EOO09_14695 [Chitinophagaceae bacterium]|nr:MAG: hypothetical protein EOO09_14695 [Chitinophagaceae bacterium]